MRITQTQRHNQPLGIFDSGVGGLTVASRISEILPNERIIYLGDQEHVPYGGRDLSEIRRFAGEISRALIFHGCKAVIMACNISSATALKDVSQLNPDILTLGVICPGAASAATTTRNGRIGVLATAGTVKSGEYTRQLLAIDPCFEVTEVACPQFVPLVEAGAYLGPIAREAAREYLAPLEAQGVDTIILGCTHYPFLVPELRMLSAATFIDPAEATAQTLAVNLRAREQAAENMTAWGEPHLLLTTASAPVAGFRLQAEMLAPGLALNSEFGAAHWHAGRLVLPHLTSEGRNAPETRGTLGARHP